MRLRFQRAFLFVGVKKAEKKRIIKWPTRALLRNSKQSVLTTPDTRNGSRMVIALNGVNPNQVSTTRATTQQAEPHIPRRPAKSCVSQRFIWFVMRSYENEHQNNVDMDAQRGLCGNVSITTSVGRRPKIWNGKFTYSTYSYVGLTFRISLASPPSC